MNLDEYNELLIKANKYDELMTAKSESESYKSEQSIEKYRPEISG